MEGEHLSAPNLEAVTDAFTALTDETRLNILLELALEEPSPTSYTTIKSRVGIEDSGHFHYHLDKLTGPFVRKTDQGYRIRPAGRQCLSLMRTGYLTEHVESEPQDITADCPQCSTRNLEAWYDDGELYVVCDQCGSRPVRTPFPPWWIANTEFDSALRAFSRMIVHMGGYLMRGFCPACDGRIQLYTDPEDEYHWHDFSAVARCDTCQSLRYGTIGGTFLTHPAVVAFYYEHGVDVWEPFYWEFPQCVSHEGYSLLNEDPLEIELVLEEEGDELRLVFDDELNVLRTERIERAGVGTA